MKLRTWIILIAIGSAFWTLIGWNVFFGIVVMGICFVLAGEAVIFFGTLIWLVVKRILK